MTEYELPKAIRDEWLRRLRRARGVSQKSLSAGTGLAQNMISMLETGDRALSMKSAERLAEELDVDPVALYVSAYTDAVVKAVQSETSFDGHELSKLVRLRSRLGNLAVEDELPDSPELNAAVDHLLETIEALQGADPDPRSARKSRRDDEDEPVLRGRALDQWSRRTP